MTLELGKPCQKPCAEQEPLQPIPARPRVAKPLHAPPRAVERAKNQSIGQAPKTSIPVNGIYSPVERLGDLSSTSVPKVVGKPRRDDPDANERGSDAEDNPVRIKRLRF